MYIYNIIYIYIYIYLCVCVCVCVCVVCSQENISDSVLRRVVVDTIVENFTYNGLISFHFS